MKYTEIWNSTLIQIGDYTLATSQLLMALLIIVITLLVTTISKKSFRRLASGNSRIPKNLAYIISRFANYLIIFVGFLLAVSALGVDVSKLALVASALGIGIGLGLQGIVNNFVSGLAILLEGSLKVGDFIELDSGITGEVIEIHMRATLIRTNDNVDILIPNADLTNGNVINWTLEDCTRRFRIPFGVAYGSDKEVVKEAVLAAAKTLPYTLSGANKDAVVWMTGFGDSSLNFTLGVWVDAAYVKRPTTLLSDYLWAIDDALRAHNIEIPFPQRDLHIRSNDTNSSLS